MRSGFRRCPVNVLLVAIILAAVSALLTTESNSSASQGPTASAPAVRLQAAVAAEGGGTPELSELSATQRMSFSVLSAAARPMPAAIAGMVSHSRAAMRYGLNTRLARPVDSEGDAWVIPGQGELCLWITDPVDGGGIGCATTSRATAGELSISLLSGGPDPTDHIVGLIPDGAGALSVSNLETGAVRRISVSPAGDSWEATIPDGSHLLAFDIGGSPHTVSAP